MYYICNDGNYPAHLEDGDVPEIADLGQDVERGAEAFLRREENEEDLDFQIFQNFRKNLQKV
jgi:hypothetical protein